MSKSESPFLLIRQLESDVTRLLAQLDIALLTLAEQRKVSELKHSLIDARLEIQDYELAETREDQLRNAKDSKKYLHTAQTIVSSNTIHVFGAVDVAHIVAQIGQIIDRLR